MVAELVALTVGVLVALAELVHAFRVRRVAGLAFGPSRKPSLWARTAPLVRIASLCACTWGLTTLLLIEPKVHRAEALDKNQLRHLVMLLDVSPSMRLHDAGSTKKEARQARVAALMKSFFERAPEPFRMSVVAFYNGAKPVVVDTIDMEVVQNILTDLPMHYAFEVGQTKLFDGLEEVARIAKPWEPGSTTLVVLTDGDTVPASGMPKLPASVSHVLVVGVGDPRAGSFIDGRQSRQDASTLRQVAVRLGGHYHDGNEKQIATDVLNIVTQQLEDTPFDRLSRREYALLACGLGGGVYVFLPVLLALWGTNWRPGTRPMSRVNPARSNAVFVDSPNQREIDTHLTGSVR